MVDQVWTTVLGAAIPTGLSLFVIMLTRERSNGRDHTLTTQSAQDVAALKVANVEIQTTLATHTTLHSQASETLRNTDRRLRELERRQSEAFGREQGRRHETK